MKGMPTDQVLKKRTVTVVIQGVADSVRRSVLHRNMTQRAAGQIQIFPGHASASLDNIFKDQ